MHAASVLGALGALALSMSAMADDVIYTTGNPYGGPIGVTGFDVYENQSVAIRFTAPRDCTLTRVSLWLMANTTAGQEIAPTMRVTIRGDAGLIGEQARPAPDLLASWVCTVPPTPWQPASHTLACEQEVVLAAGQHYWVVAESDCERRRNPVWNWSGSDFGLVALRANDGEWSAMQGSAVCVELRAEDLPRCRSGDVNGDGDFGTDQDIEAFFACLTGSCCTTCDAGVADFNRDGDFGTDQDIESFFRVLGGGGC